MTAIVRPVFIVSAPRAGSSLLFRTLMQAPDVFTIGRESHQLIEGIAPLHPRAHGWHSNRLTSEDADPDVVTTLYRAFYEALRDREGRAPAGPARMIEKTPKNSLRVPFLHAAFPDATFVYLHRDVRETLSSMIEAWESRRFRTYPDLPGWPQGTWSLLLVPGWRDLRGRDLPEIVAQQWATASRILLDDLSALPAGQVRPIRFADFLAAPQASIAALCASLEIDWDQALTSPLPLSPSVVSPPRPGKWQDNEDAIAEILEIVRGEAERAEEFAAAAADTA